MPLTTPNAEDSPTYQAQAVLDKTDLAALSLAVQQTGVISGMTVTAGGGYNVNVAAGVIQVGWDQQNVSAVTGLAPAAASSTDRRDIVVCSTTGTVSIVAGTPTTETAVPWTTTSLYNPPVKPSIPANSVLLAEIYIPGGGGTIASGWITDKTTITAVLSSAWPEGLVRLNSLSQMRPPDSSVSFNSQRLANLLNGASTQDAAAMGQLGAWIPDVNTWTLSTNTTTIASTMNGLGVSVQTTVTGSTINTTPSTVTVGNTSGFPASGSFSVHSISGGTNTTVNYTAIGSGTTFSNCTVASGSVTTTTGDTVTGGVNVASTTGFPASGYFLVNHSGTNYPVYYTALTSTAFVGCTGYASTVSTSDVVSPGAFTISSSTNLTSQYSKGTKLQWAESGTVKYGVVKTSSFASSTTTVYLMPTSDYYMLATPDVQTNYYCYTNPPGFPTSFTWVPGHVGFSTLPTLPFCGWWIQDGICTLSYDPLIGGTSNATSYLVVAPVPSSSLASQVYGVSSVGEDNGAATMTNATLVNGQTYIAMGKQPSLTGPTAWTASGAKNASFLLSYPI